MIFGSILGLLDCLIGLPRDEKGFEYPFWRLQNFYPNVWINFKWLFNKFFVSLGFKFTVRLKVI
jgi:hypothetical protein